MRIGQDTIIPNGPQDLSNSWTSDPILLEHVSNYSIQLVFSGTLTGTWSLQSSTDEGHTSQATEATRAQGVENWTTIFGSEQAIVEAGDHTWNVQQAGYKWVRIAWEPSSGTGSLDSARFYTKGF